MSNGTSPSCTVMGSSSLSPDSRTLFSWTECVGMEAQESNAFFIGFTYRTTSGNRKDSVGSRCVCKWKVICKSRATCDSLCNQVKTPRRVELHLDSFDVDVSV